MTEEQMKSLKVGDRFVVTLEVTAEAEQDVTGLWCIDAQPVGHNGTHQSHTYDTECLSVVPLLGAALEVGDTVRIVNAPLTGTIYSATHRRTDVKDGAEAVVISRTDGMGMVKISLNIAGKPELDGIYVNVHCLELVKKAVKDKYTTRRVRVDYYAVEKKDSGYVVAKFTIGSHPNAKAAAKAECARLNAEWRKKQDSAAVCDSGVTVGGGAR